MLGCLIDFVDRKGKVTTICKCSVYRGTSEVDWRPYLRLEQSRAAGVGVAARRCREAGQTQYHLLVVQLIELISLVERWLTEALW